LEETLEVMMVRPIRGVDHSLATLPPLLGALLVAIYQNPNDPPTRSEIDRE
jgi:hypothetical protein